LYAKRLALLPENNILSFAYITAGPLLSILKSPQAENTAVKEINHKRNIDHASPGNNVSNAMQVNSASNN